MRSPDLFIELIGGSGQSRAAATAAFADRGISVALSTIPQYRRRRLPWDGNRGAIARLDYSLFKEKGDPTAKIEHYFTIGQTGVELRSPQKIRPHRLSSFGLTESIAEQLGLTTAELSSRLRAIRVDICSSEAMEPDQRVGSMFLDVVEKYVNAYTKPANADINERVKAISAKWDGSTIGDFYRTLYEKTSGPGIGTWVPYELGFIRDCYQILGEGQPRLSPFDRFSLEAMIKGKAVKYAADLRGWIGILVAKNVIYSHVGVLTASPTPKT